MNKIFFGGLITLLATVNSTVIAAEVTPANLVSQGYQGRLSAAGIPGYAPFLQGVYLGKIDAEDLIEGAISQGKLDSDLSDDEAYLGQVNSALFLLRAGGGSR